MSLVGWIVLGLIAGFTANQYLDKGQRNLIYDATLGVVGAVVAGSLLRLVFGEGHLEVLTAMGALSGAILLLGVNHVTRLRQPKHA